MKEVTIRHDREAAAGRRHPWIFSGALQEIPPEISAGDRVMVVSSSRAPIAIGHYLGGSIAVKVVSFDLDSMEAAVTGALAQAVRRREILGLFDNPDTNAFRLVHGESDSLPGLIVDLYGRTAVMQIQSPGMARERELIAEELKTLLRERIDSLYEKAYGSDEGSGRYLFGAKGEQTMRENGLRYRVDWECGQKTGFFLDQRENRRLAARLLGGRAVLNLFSYTGGFSVSALAGGAKRVLSVDSSRPALELAEENAALNGFKPRHSVERADCFERLIGPPGEFDAIICDPPALAKHRSAVRNGEKAYVSLNREAMTALPAGGILFTFSCSQLISRPRFRELLFEAALRANRRTVILTELHQAPCHPVDLFCPETEYLKGFALLVE
jgi:23S rRNA (cytosine1962-C5)-methyltransferase